MQPEVSVLMAVRDGEPWIAEACRSILDQSYTSLELIVVDDGSSDGTPVILSGLAELDSRMRVQRQQPAGLVAALNRAVAMARGRWLARLDADDVALPERLARQVSFLEAHPDVVLLGTWAERIDAGGGRLGLLQPECEPAPLAAMLATRNPFVHSSVIMRAEDLRAVGGYRSVCEAAEDYDLWLRLAERGTIANLPDVLTRYRWHPDGVSQRRAARQGFSARLARRAAQQRRLGQADPLAAFDARPDWWAADADGTFHADDARLYRLLELAESGPPAPERLARIELPSPLTMLELSHVEKVILRKALLHLLRMRERPASMTTGRIVRVLLASLLGRRLSV